MNIQHVLEPRLLTPCSSPTLAILYAKLFPMIKLVSSL